MNVKSVLHEKLNTGPGSVGFKIPAYIFYTDSFLYCIDRYTNSTTTTKLRTLPDIYVFQRNTGYSSTVHLWHVASNSNPAACLNLMAAQLKPADF